jgi:hypothetical protein
MCDEPGTSTDCEKQPLIVEGGQVSELLAWLMTKPFVALAFVFVFALIQFLRFGNVHDYLLLAVGSLLSGAAIFGYGFIPLLNRETKSSRLTLLALAGFIPYAFGCYLVFYKGFWGLKNLFTKFTVGGLLACALFVVLGYWVVNGMYLLTELVDKAAKREVILK